MPNAVSAVTIEHEGYTYLALWAPAPLYPRGPLPLDLMPEEHVNAYHRGRLIPSARPVRPVRCYEGARS